MFRVRIGLCAALVALSAFAAIAQQPRSTTNRDTLRWRDRSGATRTRSTRVAARPDSEAAATNSTTSGRSSGASASSLAGITKGTGVLPNDHGQIWREYDISDYTLSVTDTKRPEQAVIDWILRETGYETWHSGPLAILSAPNSRTLIAYHTPEIQAVVADLIDRFLAAGSQSHGFGIRVITIGNPNWRARSKDLLKPIPAQTQGVQAWLVQKEDASLLATELAKRTDFREHSSPHLLVNNGQSTTVSRTRTRTYVQNLLSRPEAWPGYEAELAEIDEGFTIELSPLLSLDNDMIDAVIKLKVDQIEKLHTVVIDVPTTVAPRQRAQVEVPQMSQRHMQERFRWPEDKVLLVGLGMIALPVPAQKSPLNLTNMTLRTGPPRADLLVFIEHKGPIDETGNGGRRVRRTDSAATYRNRY